PFIRLRRNTVPADLWTDAGRMAGCGLAIATVAVPVGLIGWAMARRLGVSLLPCPLPWRVPWTGLEVALAFLVLNVVIPGLVLEALAQSAFFQWVYGPGFPSATSLE